VQLLCAFLRLSTSRRGRWLGSLFRSSEESQVEAAATVDQRDEEQRTLPHQQSTRSGPTGVGGGTQAAACDDFDRALWLADMQRWMAGRLDHGDALRHLTEAVRLGSSTPHDRLWHLLNAIICEERSRRAAAAAGVPPPGDRFYASFFQGHSQ
jgi:hypothetical protein